MVAMSGERLGYHRAKEILAEKCAPASLLIIAPDLLRKERLLKNLAQNFFGGKDQAPLRRLKGGALNSRDLAFLDEESHSLSLFSANRYVVIDDIEEIKAETAKQLAHILENSPAAGLSIFLLAKELPAANVLYKFHAKIALLIKLESLKDAELSMWAAKEIESQGINSCAPEARESLLALAEGSLDKLAQYISHAALFSTDGNLDEKTVDMLFPEKVAANEYEIFDYLSQNNSSRAELQLAMLLRSGKNPFLLLSLVSRTYLSYYSIRACLDQGMSVPQVSEKLKIPPWLLHKHITAMGKRTRKRLSRDIRSILKTDSRLKNRSVGPDAVLSGLISELAHHS